MADLQTLNNGDSYGVQRAKINSNNEVLNAAKMEASQVLTRTNTDGYTPTEDGNPSTKGYVDQSLQSFKDIFDPNGINADAFARENHTGTQAPSTIETDASNRFVTDTEKASWNNKEDSIGGKGTAFNKNFGTGSEEVARGNHTHTKSEIGLGNVSNTSDADKPVSTAQQTALDQKQTIGEEQDLVKFNTGLSSFPAHLKGLLFWDDLHNALSYYMEQVDVVLNIGKEFVGDVYNNTGSTIPNGTVLAYGIGVDPTTDRPYVVPAKADSFLTSSVIGVATHDIPNGTVGIATTLGVVHDVDTSAYAAGTIIYLSDQVAGAFSDTQGGIASTVGAVVKQGTTNGAIFVKITNNTTYPTTFGQLYQLDSPSYALTTAWQDINAYTNSREIITTTDKVTGQLSPDYDGVYRLSFTINLSFTSSAQTRTIYVRLYDVTAGSEVSSIDSSITIPKDETSASRSFSVPFDAIGGDAYAMQVSASTSMTVSIDDVSLDLQSISLEGIP